MKNVLFTLALLLTLSMGMQAAGQKHRHTPRNEQVDSTGKDAVEAFSDTTSTDTMTSTRHKGKVTITTPTSPWSSNTVTYEMEDEDFIEFDSLINIRPYQGNRSRDVQDPAVRKRIVEVVNKLIL